MSDTVRVLIVDDGELFAESLRRVLTLMPGSRIDVCAVANTGEKAIEYADSLDPDVVLMDIRMPGLDGIQATRQILERNPKIRIIVLTNFDDDDYVYDAIDAGASGYLLKDITPDKLKESVESANDHSVVFASSIAAKFTRNRRARETQDMPAWFRELSRREKEILACVVKGQTNKEIAVTLNVAEQTVRNNVSDIYSKSEIHDRVKLIEAVRNLLLS